MTSYGQFCPVAKAAEILDQRWMLLVVRELIAGHEHFNDLHRGVPRMSRSLLSKRLKQLVDANLVERRTVGGSSVYRLTAAGEQLGPVIDALGEWGVRWIDSLAEEDLDPAFLLWDMHRSIDVASLPAGQTVLELRFEGLPPGLRNWWLLLSKDDIEICEEDHGFDVDVSITAPIRTFVRLWRGDLGWGDALNSGMQLRGPEQLRRQVPQWLRLSHFAAVPRPEHA